MSVPPKRELRYKIILEAIRSHGGLHGVNRFMYARELGDLINDTGKAQHFVNTKSYESMESKYFKLEPSSVPDMYKAMKNAIKDSDIWVFWEEGIGRVEYFVMKA